jgi:hypothetical protein
LVFLFICFIGKARAADSEGFIFEWSYAPNRVYTNTVLVDSTSYLTMKGKSKAAKEKLKTSQFPVEVKSSQRTGSVFTTDKTDQYGNIPFICKILEHSNTNIANGKVVPSILPDILEELVYTGIIDGKTKKVNVISIKGKNFPPEAESIIKDMVGEVQDQIQMPDYPLRPGDTFTKRLKLNIPVPGLQPVDMFIVMKFTLEKIEFPLAFFDIKNDLELAMQESEINVTAKGGGSGSMRFDIENQLPIDYIISLKMKVTLDTPEVKMVVKSKSNNKMEFEEMDVAQQANPSDSRSTGQ